VVLLFTPTAGSGSRNAVSYDGDPFHAPVLVIDYSDPVATVVGPQELPVCVPPDLNPNLPGGAEATDVQLMADCVERVQSTLSGLSEACGYPSKCDCTVVDDSRRFSDACDQTCVEDPVNPDCGDFNPITGDVKATNATGDQPVCLANSPLAFGIYGRRTTCH